MQGQTSFYGEPQGTIDHPLPREHVSLISQVYV
jgi:hypothetical protein